MTLYRNTILRIVVLSSFGAALPGTCTFAQERAVVAPAGVVSWDEMRAAEEQAAHDRVAESPRVVPFMPAPAPRDIGPLGGVVAPTRPLPVAPSASAVGPTSITGFAALSDNDTAIPPDTMGAVGPNHLMVMLNTQVRIANKAGTVSSTISLSTFWTTGTGLAGAPFDPHVVFDPLSSRWIATVFADGDQSTSAVWLAVSATGDPTGTWRFFGWRADASGATWADYPGLGMNATWIAITANMFGQGGEGTFAGVKMWVIEKSALLSGGTLTTTEFPTGFDQAAGFSTFTLKPVVSFDANDPNLYLLDNPHLVQNGTIPVLRLSRISGSRSNPMWSVLPGSVEPGAGVFPVVHTFTDGQIDAEQSGVASTCSGGPNDGSTCRAGFDCQDPGACRRITTGDTRMADPVFRNGKIWCAHSAGLPVAAFPNRTAVFWYELDPSLMAATGDPIVQSGVLDGGVGVHHFYPSVGVNQNGDVLIGFSRADASRFVEAVVVGRAHTDPAGTMSAPTVLKAGEASYFKTFGETRNRWGDYSATVVDPADDRTIWTIQEYAAQPQGDDRWGTWWGKASFAPCTADADCDDGNGCTTDTCNVTTGNCAHATEIASVCRAPLLPKKSSLVLKDATPDAKDGLTWNWTKGAATTVADFGDPLNTTAYDLCMYDQSAGTTTLQLRATVPAGGTCGTKPCWQATATGFKYTNKMLTPDGVKSVQLKAGADGKASVKVKGQGINLGMPSLPLATTVTVQLRSSDGQCWGADFSVPTNNESAQFKAKSD